MVRSRLSFEATAEDWLRARKHRGEKAKKRRGSKLYENVASKLDLVRSKPHGSFAACKTVKGRWILGA